MQPEQDNAALSGVPKGIRLLCLVLPAAERRGGSGTHRSAPRSPRSEAEGGTSYYLNGSINLNTWSIKKQLDVI